jgi:phosphatidylserine decarboxylase precursor
MLFDGFALLPPLPSRNDRFVKFRMKHTIPLRFWSSNRTRQWSNPARRWIPLKLGLGITTLCISTVPVSYYLASRRSPDEPAALAGNEIVTIMELLPLNLMSRYIGYSASLDVLPQQFHHQIIRWMIQYYKITDVSENDLSQFRTVQEFFLRDRIQAPTIDEGCPLVSPCDGMITETGELRPAPLVTTGVKVPFNVKEQHIGIQRLEASRERLIQAKGVHYPVGALLGLSSLPPVPAGYRRWFWTFYLQPGAYHHFHNPADHFQAEASVYLPGMLFPVSPSVARWLPNLYINNERVNLIGTFDLKRLSKKAKDSKDAKDQATTSPSGGGTPTSSSSSFVAMSFIGATNVGGIYFPFDERIVTNPPIALGRFGLRRDYKEELGLKDSEGEASAAGSGSSDVGTSNEARKKRVQLPTFAIGEKLGCFKLGSSIVLIADIPKEGVVPLGRRGDKVEIGQRLLEVN